MNEFVLSDIRENEKDVNSGFALLSHDLRSSLAGVLGSLSLVDMTELSDNNRGQILRARASAKMLQEMLDLAFDISSDRKNGLQGRNAVDVRAELDLVADIWSVQAKARSRVFTLDVEEGIGFLKSDDRVSFHRVINNIIGNANKYSDKGTIAVHARRDDDMVEITIYDDGPGFSKEALDTLFQFGGRPENSAKPGTGLGLYIAKTLVKSMHGSISVENLPEQGAKVTVRLPRWDQNGAQASAEDLTTSETKVSDLPDLSNLHILLAEDNLTNQLVITQMLQTMNAQFTVASDGLEALRELQNGQFDIVLLDIEMPRKSGLEVLTEVRATGSNYPDIPIVALTAYVMRDHRDRIMAAGANGIIPKPIDGIGNFGRAILSYLGAETAPQPNFPQPRAVSVSEEEIGSIDQQIYQDLKLAIGPEAMNDFLGKVTDDLRNIQTNLADGQDRNDMKALGGGSHTLISVSGAIGATHLQAAAQELNKASKTEDSQMQQELSKLCIAGIEKILDTLSV